jgi:hypothetical protein
MRIASEAASSPFQYVSSKPLPNLFPRSTRRFSRKDAARSPLDFSGPRTLDVFAVIEFVKAGEQFSSQLRPGPRLTVSIL